MSSFPAIEPFQRRFSLGALPVAQLQTSTGVSIRFRIGTDATAFSLQLDYIHLSAAEAKQIRDHYNAKQGSLIFFLLPSIIWSGHGSNSLVAPFGTEWRYAAPPEETQRKGGLVNVSVQLASILDPVSFQSAKTDGAQLHIAYALTSGSPSAGATLPGIDPAVSFVLSAGEAAEGINGADQVLIFSLDAGTATVINGQGINEVINLGLSTGKAQSISRLSLSVEMSLGSDGGVGLTNESLATLNDSASLELAAPSVELL
jgi:hypothetical protein